MAGGWREQTNGAYDGVVVFNEAGDVEVRTTSASRLSQPISIRVANLQSATLNSANAMAAERARIIVNLCIRRVSILDEEVDLHVLETYNAFSLDLVVGERVLSVAGLLLHLPTLRVRQMQTVALRSS